MQSEKKKWILCVGVIGLLTVAVAVQEKMEPETDPSVVLRQEEGNGAENQTLYYQIDGGEEQELTLEVNPVQRSEEEAEELLSEAVEQWEASYLGNNDSPNEVRSDLKLQETYCDGLVNATFEFSEYSAIDVDGQICSDGLGEEGTLVELTAEFSYGDIKRTEKRTVRILPPETGSLEWIKQKLSEQVTEEEAETRSEADFLLPDTVGDSQITWSQEKETPRWVWILLLGLTAIIAMMAREREQARKKKKEREEKLLSEYPQMVEQLSMLIGSGMTIRGAWERVLQTNQRMQKETGKPPYTFIEEMWITWREINQGQSEKRAYETFGSRIGLMPYRRLGSILAQNLQKGTKDVKRQMDEEAREALELRKNHAKQLGEEAGTKMLFPMMLMFLLILIVLLLPAVNTFM